MINIRRTEKIGLLLLKVFCASKRIVCTGAEMHRRGIAHRMDMVHRA
jgi:hypothetical protein